MRQGLDTNPCVCRGLNRGTDGLFETPLSYNPRIADPIASNLLERRCRVRLNHSLDLSVFYIKDVTGTVNEMDLTNVLTALKELSFEAVAELLAAETEGSGALVRVHVE